MGGMMVLFIGSGVHELVLWTESPSKEPGNFGDPFRVGQYDTEMRSRELNNGRFADGPVQQISSRAMFALMGRFSRASAPGFACTWRPFCERLQAPPVASRGVAVPSFRAF